MTAPDADGAFLLALMRGYRAGVDQRVRPLPELVERLEKSVRRLIRVRTDMEAGTGVYDDASVIYDAVGLVEAVKRESLMAGSVAEHIFEEAVMAIYSGTPDVYRTVRTLLDLGRAFIRSETPAA
ncbi:hypothetical protein [Streptomyces sp. NPDC101776]|uniref:hypothetical protein n=1 Tax=Streptomyces sp. NPDC101776 TaxID=3366146 RepID=UPI003804F0EF